MKEYSKRIQITDTGMVIGEVFASDGRRVGLMFCHSGIFNSPNAIEKRAKKANKWADQMMKVCERQEIGHAE